MFLLSNFLLQVERYDTGIYENAINEREFTVKKKKFKCLLHTVEYSRNVFHFFLGQSVGMIETGGIGEQGNLDFG